MDPIEVNRKKVIVVMTIHLVTHASSSSVFGQLIPIETMNIGYLIIVQYVKFITAMHSRQQQIITATRTRAKYLQNSVWRVTIHSLFQE